MKYAITYALDDTWQSVDTLLVESDSNPLDMPSEEMADIFEAYGIEAERAKELAKDSDYWFIRNADDVDVNNTMEEE